MQIFDILKNGHRHTSSKNTFFVVWTFWISIYMMDNPNANILST